MFFLLSTKALNKSHNKFKGALYTIKRFASLHKVGHNSQLFY